MGAQLAARIHCRFPRLSALGLQRPGWSQDQATNIGITVRERQNRARASGGDGSPREARQARLSKLGASWSQGFESSVPIGRDANGDLERGCTGIWRFTRGDEIGRGDHPSRTPITNRFPAGPPSSSVVRFEHAFDHRECAGAPSPAHVTGLVHLEHGG